MSQHQVRLSSAAREFALVLRVSDYTYPLCGEEEDNYLDGAVEAEYHRVGDYRVVQPTAFESAWIVRFADQLEALLAGEASEVSLDDIELSMRLTVARGGSDAAGAWICSGSLRPTYQAAFSFEDIAVDADELRALVAQARELTRQFPPRWDAAGG